MKISRLSFFFFPISIQLCVLTFAQSTDQFQLCSTSTTYNSNLNHVFSTIINDTQTDYGFYNVSYGENPDQVNAIALCRGDLKPHICRSCIEEAMDVFTESCDNHIVWLDDQCMLRYSNSSLSGKMELQPYRALINGDNATNVTEFNQGLGTLLNGLITQAASGDSFRKFATGNVAVSDSQTIYAMAQCTPDLSQWDCKDCLNNATDLLSQCCSGRLGANVLTPSCNIRYEKELFYEPLAAMPPAPVSNAPASPPVGGIAPVSHAPVAPPVDAPVGDAPVLPPVGKAPVPPPVDAPVDDAPVSPPVDAPSPLPPPIDAPSPLPPPVDAPLPSPIVAPGPLQLDQPYIETGEGNMKSGFQILSIFVPLMILQLFVF
ncbi:hypothetical protein PTKIN_Ptkin18bG0120200 [Pterospermum kingtungense]